jgi:hypothetical protein
LQLAGVQAGLQMARKAGTRDNMALLVVKV